MSFPASWARIPVTATYLLRDDSGTPATGRVEFRSAQIVVADGSIIVPVRVTATLDSAGHISLELPATDDPDIQPNSWTWSVTEIIDRQPRRTYSLAVPHTASSIDLSSISPIPPGSPVYDYLLTSAIGVTVAGQGDLDVLDGRVTALEGAGGGVQLSDDTPESLGTASAGVSTEASRSDHVHALPTAADVGADTAGAASAAITAHESASDPHPQYTTVSEAAAAAPVQSVAGRAGDITLTTADISDSTPTGRAVLTAADAATARTAIDAPSSAQLAGVQAAAEAALPKAGGTMTGLVVLSGTPSDALHAATKQYVDESLAAGLGAGIILTDPIGGKWRITVDSAGVLSTVTADVPDLTSQVQALFAKYSAAGGMWDFTDMATLFQDSAGTTPVTASGQSIGRALDISGSGNHVSQGTEAARPTWNPSTGAVFDGVDDSFVTAANLDLSSSAAVVCVGFTSNSNGYQKILELGPDAATSNGLALVRGYAAAGDYTAYLYGTSLGYRVSQNFVSPDAAVVSIQYNIAEAGIAAQVKGSRNGTEWTYSSSAGGAGTGTLVSNLLSVGKASGGSTYFNGSLRRAIIIGAVLTADDRTLIEAWAAEGA